MSRITVRVRGIEELQTKFASFNAEAEVALDEALGKVGDAMVTLAKKDTPVDTGKLRDSIRWEMHADEAHTIKVFSDVIYAGFVEFGHKGAIAGGIFEGASIPPAPARPFFFPAFRLARRRAKGHMSRAMKRAKQKVGAV